MTISPAARPLAKISNADLRGDVALSPADALPGRARVSDGLITVRHEAPAARARVSDFASPPAPQPAPLRAPLPAAALAADRNFGAPRPLEISEAAPALEIVPLSGAAAEFSSADSDAKKK